MCMVKIICFQFFFFVGVEVIFHLVLNVCILFRSIFFIVLFVLFVLFFRLYSTSCLLIYLFLPLPYHVSEPRISSLSLSLSLHPPPFLSSMLVVSLDCISFLRFLSSSSELISVFLLTSPLSLTYPFLPIHRIFPYSLPLFVFIFVLSLLASALALCSLSPLCLLSPLSSSPILFPSFALQYLISPRPPLLIYPLHFFPSFASLYFFIFSRSL